MSEFLNFANRAKNYVVFIDGSYHPSNIGAACIFSPLDSEDGPYKSVCLTYYLNQHTNQVCNLNSLGSELASLYLALHVIDSIRTKEHKFLIKTDFDSILFTKKVLLDKNSKLDGDFSRLYSGCKALFQKITACKCEVDIEWIPRNKNLADLYSKYDFCKERSSGIDIKQSNLAVVYMPIERYLGFGFNNNIKLKLMPEEEAKNYNLGQYFEEREDKFGKSISGFFDYYNNYYREKFPVKQFMKLPFAYQSGILNQYLEAMQEKLYSLTEIDLNILDFIFTNLENRYNGKS